MAFIKLQFKPGVNRDQTDYSNEGGWYACDKIRFRSGYPQKIGGIAQKAAPMLAGMGLLNSVSGQTQATGATGCTETRPRNIALLYCIKY